MGGRVEVVAMEVAVEVEAVKVVREWVQKLAF